MGIMPGRPVSSQPAESTRRAGTAAAGHSTSSRVDGHKATLTETPETIQCPARIASNGRSPALQSAAEMPPQANLEDAAPAHPDAAKIVL